MKQYNELLKEVLENGVKGGDRTGTGTIATFGEQLKFDMRKGFPAMTTKKLAFKSVVAELLWFLRGSTDLNELRAITHGEEHRHNKEKKTIWDANYEKQGQELGYDKGYVGFIYGQQWRNYGLDAMVDGDGFYHELPIVDQVHAVLKEAQANPTSRRLLVEAYNPQLTWDHTQRNSEHTTYQIDKPILPPCHTGFQINIQGDDIDLLFKMRSVDVFLGMPFDIASYGVLLGIFARILGKTPRTLACQFGNTHIYLNHIEQVNEQLSRTPFDLPELWINPELKTLEDFEKATVDDFKLIGYHHHPAIKAPMSA